MRQETNNAIDLLLRRLGRRRDGVSDANSDHLDADELSSYAENSLPAAARARYTEHLAECSSCRKMVVQLSSAAGVVVAPERVVAAAPSGLRKFLASLFTPMVLRYAIPALGLAVIAVIGLTVFRRDQQVETDVAQRSTAPAPANEQLKTPAASSSDDYKGEAGKSAPAATPEAGRINLAKEPTPTPAPTALDRISAPVVGATDSAANAAPPPKPEQQPIANTPAPSPAPEITERKVQELETQKKEVARKSEVAREPHRERAYQAGEEGRRSAEGAAPASAPAEKKKGDFSSATPGAGVVTLQQSEKDSDNAGTRTVAGRRFRKQRGVWVDTAYASSSETLNLTRGSERYRSIVADEPGIKNIADQLDGEIIVVWKGRAYRIR